MIPKTLLGTAIAGAALVLAVPALAGSPGVAQNEAAVLVSPDRADRAAVARQSANSFLLDTRESRAFEAKREAATAEVTSTAGPVHDDHILDTASTSAPGVTTSSGRDIEWPQIGIGFGVGVLLVVCLLLGARMTRSRQPAH
jgi:hypothetical protein